jgi:hypothetical protein
MLYTINADAHYCNQRWLSMVFSNTISFQASFDSNCLYDNSTFPDWEKESINKLWGLNNGFSEDNSARFGWRCLDGENIQLLAYCHLGGPYTKPSTGDIVIGQVKPGEIFTGKIILGNYFYGFIFNDGPQINVASPAKPSWIKFQDYPYFGGQMVAPHFMSLNIIKK